MTPDDEYWAACERREFVLQRCTHCATWQFPPTSVCSRCLNEKLEWQPASGNGTVWSWIRMHKSYFKRLELELPYRVALIELAEGPRMISTVLGPDEVLECGAPVELVYGPSGDGTIVPMFRLAS